jgi:hypothetical protein
MQLSWKATDKPPRYCKWAVLYAGNKFLIYHILRISELDGSHPTVIMTYSDPIAINDIETPYIALLVYMMLSADQSHSSLATTLGVTTPEGTRIVDETESEEEESNRRSEEESNRRSEETVVSMLTNGGKSTDYYITTRANLFRQLIVPLPALYRRPRKSPSHLRRTLAARSCTSVYPSLTNLSPSLTRPPPQTSVLVSYLNQSPPYPVTPLS